MYIGSIARPCTLYDVAAAIHEHSAPASVMPSSSS